MAEDASEGAGGSRRIAGAVSVNARRSKLKGLFAVVLAMFCLAGSGEAKEKRPSKYDAYLGKSTEEVVKELGPPEDSGTIAGLEGFTYLKYHPKSVSYAKRTGFLTLLFKDGKCIRWDLKPNYRWNQPVQYVEIQ